MENKIVDAFVREAVLAGADDVIISEDEVDPETNAIKFVAVKR